MLNLPEFELLHPRTFAEALALMAGSDDTEREDGGADKEGSPATGTRERANTDGLAISRKKTPSNGDSEAGAPSDRSVLPMAGGTDLLPNMKHGLRMPKRIIDLKSIREGREIELEGNEIRLGALCSIADLAQHPGIHRRLPALATACEQIASPQIREMGTLGGNLCLDTRCVYYNQSHFWRKSLGFCLKKDGDICHVVKAGRRCVAAASADTAPVLIALGARALLVSARGSRLLPLSEFFVADGARNTVLRSGELLREVRIPPPTASTRMAFQKLRARGAIDFPMLSVALVFSTGLEHTLNHIRLILGALGAKPREVTGLETLVVGRPIDRELTERVADRAFRQARPLSNIEGDLSWRREMARVLVKRAFEAALPDREGLIEQEIHGYI